MFTENKKLDFFIGLGLLVIATVVYPAIFMAVFFRLTDVANGYPLTVYGLAVTSELAIVVIAWIVLIIRNTFCKD